MKLFPHEADRVARWPLFCLFVFIALFMSAGFPSSAAAQAAPTAPEPKATPIGVRLVKGKPINWPLTVTNSCRKSHKFNVKSNANYIRFDKPTSAKLAPGESRVFGALIDGATLNAGTYDTSVVWECPDCLKEKACMKKTENEILLNILVVEPRPGTSQRLSTLAHGDLAARFFKVIENALEEHNAKLTDGAKTLLSQMIDKGAVNIGGQQTAEKLEQADANLRKFIKKAVELAQAKADKKPAAGMSFAPASKTRAAKIELNEEIIKQTQFALCPLFPFC